MHACMHAWIIRQNYVILGSVVLFVCKSSESTKGEIFCNMFDQIQFLTAFLAFFIRLAFPTVPTVLREEITRGGLLQ